MTNPVDLGQGDRLAGEDKHRLDTKSPIELAVERLEGVLQFALYSPQLRDDVRTVLAALQPLPVRQEEPLAMVLHCPACGLQHVDEPTVEWSNPPHRSHLCLGCGHIWRPADVATCGVAAVQTRGKNDSNPTDAILSVLPAKGVNHDL